MDRVRNLVIDVLFLLSRLHTFRAGKRTRSFDSYQEKRRGSTMSKTEGQSWGFLEAHVWQQSCSSFSSKDLVVTGMQRFPLGWQIRIENVMKVVLKQSLRPWMKKTWSCWVTILYGVILLLSMQAPISYTVCDDGDDVHVLYKGAKALFSDFGLFFNPELIKAVEKVQYLIDGFEIPEVPWGSR